MSQDKSNVVRLDRPLVVGTRGSALARWQTDFVIAALKKIVPGLEIRVKVITTAGDRDQNRPIAEFGAPGVFTNDLENALRRGEIDFAVHSLKDLPTTLADDLPLAAILERADARDVLVSRHGLGFGQLPMRARIGTSSARRAAQLLHLRPDLTIIPIRGNVDTRLKKAAGTDYDAIVLAAAGLLRLGRADAIVEYFSVDEMMPDPGQGALAVQGHAENRNVIELVVKINHAPTQHAVTAERAFLRALGGGCRTPIAAYAEWQGEELLLRGLVSTADGEQMVRGALSASGENPDALGALLAEQLIKNGAGAIFELEAPAPAATDNILRGKRIVITRADGQAEELAESIRAHGGEPVFFPTIAIAPDELAEGLVARGVIVTDIDAYRTIPASPTRIDWNTVDAVTFTSASTVEHAWQLLSSDERALLARHDIFCIGPVTAAAAEAVGWKVTATAGEHRLEGLVRAMSDYYRIRSMSD